MATGWARGGNCRWKIFCKRLLALLVIRAALKLNKMLVANERTFSWGKQLTGSVCVPRTLISIVSLTVATTRRYRREAPASCPVRTPASASPVSICSSSCPRRATVLKTGCWMIGQPWCCMSVINGAWAGLTNHTNYCPTFTIYSWFYPNWIRPHISFQILCFNVVKKLHF